MRGRISVIALAVAAWVTGGAPAARAEPCTGPADRSVATRAATELSSRGRMIVFCEACGDAAPGRPIDVAGVAVQPTGAGLADVLVDGRPIDLANTYVPTSDVEYRNLAALAGCVATGSSVLRVDRATATGVLIRATGAPPAAPPPATTGATPPLPPAPPGWIAGFLGGLAAFATASFVGVAAAVTRRRRPRRSSLPRAASLLDRQTRARAQAAAEAKRDGCS